MRKDESDRIQVRVVTKAEVMTIEAAARALSLLACWAGRRLQRRLDERKQGSDDAVSSVNTKGYEGENAKK